MPVELIRLRLQFVSAFLLRSEQGVVLVDTGYPLFLPLLKRRLRRHGVAPQDIRLILITHGHLDHAGGARAVREMYGAPIAMHPADLPLVRTARIHRLKPRTPLGWLTFPFAKALPMLPQWQFAPDIEIAESGFDLRPYGIEAEVMHTPGHTPGSLSVLLPAGRVLVADLVLPDFPFLHKPCMTLYADDPALVRQSLKRVLATGPRELICSHGGPLDAAQVARYFKLEN